jgi:2-oxoglutarate dehydrogenase E1 component
MSGFGQNVGYVDELYRRYLANPESVSEAWREFFEGYAPAEPAEPLPAPAPAAAPAPAPGVSKEATPLRGVHAAIAKNMEASLEVPTATSVRTIAVRFLEENRRVVNQHQATRHGSKVSFTHLVGWAVVRALKAHPAMNAAYAAVDGAPHRVPHASIRLGVAIDTQKQGERVLLVPNVKDAGSLDFPGFLAAYDALVHRARTGSLTAEDFAGTTVSLTNPGTLGTTLSVPRLMPGQGAIIGLGAIGYPPEYSGLSDEAIAGLGLSKVMTLTSTYDHRVIQGAESGSFLATVERLLVGGESFYDEIFAQLGIPQEPMKASGNVPAGETAPDASQKQAGVIQLVRAFRVRGHLSAHVDPLGSPPVHQDELELSFNGLSVWDLDKRFAAGALAGTREPRPLREILDVLRETYCRYVGVEFMHIQELSIRRWLQERMETSRNAEPLTAEQQARILQKLGAAEAFEKFLHTTYVGQKRFSLEGGETLVPMLDALLTDAADAGLKEAVIGMTHRGRLNILSNVVGKSHASIFREFEGELDPEAAHGSGDVKYHLGASGVHVAPSGTRLAVALASNPSHLEAVDPVVEGMARAKQDRLEDDLHRLVLPILLHGDAAFAGQGVVAETLNLSQLRGYRTGGTVHIVVNNQIGFTTGPRDARSSPYATDVARMVQAPIFHVNGDQPEDAVRMVRLAFSFRDTFHRDVVVDLVCYRRWGHNEADDPSFTHPMLYAKIEAKRSVRKLYTEELLRRGDLTPEAAEAAMARYREHLQATVDEVRRLREGRAEVEVAEPAEPPPEEASSLPTTAAPKERLMAVLDGLERVPDGFEVHPRLAKQLARRREQFHGDAIDWSLAETLAFGTTVLDGIPVRLSGEDTGRGTFSQRHAILYDHRSEARHIPLAHLEAGQARFQVFDSHLSEFAVLGFEYGYSVAAPEALVLWEAQFGDFANGAQVVIDQFIASAETKWRLKSAVALLLPHGYEGQGPEHSSARLERFLQLAAEGNIRVACPTTPASYFHLLRRQALDQVRKPLVVMTPKSLLRHREAVSKAAAFSEGRLEPVLDDPAVRDPAAVRRVLFCSGKVYYELDAARRESAAGDVAIARLEQLYPFPVEALQTALARYPLASDVCWVQEEPRNMGAWTFVQERLARLRPELRLRYAGRPQGSSTATGSHKRHAAEQAALVRDALSGARPAPELVRR